MTEEKLAIEGDEVVRKRPFPERKPFGLEDAAEVLSALGNQNLFSPTGKKVYEFQKRFAELYKMKYAIASNSGTSAIQTAIAAINPNPGDEIITTPVSDMGTVAAIVLYNCIPIFADIEMETFNIDPDDIETRITEKTRALIVVHCWGQPADMDRIMEIAERNNLWVIEDCAQAHLTRYKGKLVGTIGHIGAFSFQGSKHLQCGEGGVTITNDNRFGKRALLYVDKGCRWTKDRKIRLRYEFIAPSYRMTELQGAILCSQLKKLDLIVRTRQMLGDLLVNQISGIPGLHPPKRTQEVEHSYWNFPIRIEEDIFGASPTEFQKACNVEGIPVGGNWIGMPLYMFKALARYYDSHYTFDLPGLFGEIRYRKGLCPKAELALKQLRIVPILESFSELDIRDISRAIKKVALAFAKKV